MRRGSSQPLVARTQPAAPLEGLPAPAQEDQLCPSTLDVGSGPISRTAATSRVRSDSLYTAIDWPGAGGVAIAEAALPDTVVAIYRWDEANGAWLTFFPGLEDVPGLNTLTNLQQGNTYWVAITEPVTWTVPLP